MERLEARQRTWPSQQTQREAPRALAGYCSVSFNKGRIKVVLGPPDGFHKSKSSAVKPIISVDQRFRKRPGLIAIHLNHDDKGVVESELGLLLALAVFS